MGAGTPGNGRADSTVLTEPCALASGPAHQFFNQLLGEALIEGVYSVGLLGAKTEILVNTKGLPGRARGPCYTQTVR